MNMLLAHITISSQGDASLSILILTNAIGNNRTFPIEFRYAHKIKRVNNEHLHELKPTVICDLVGPSYMLHMINLSSFY